MQFYIKKYNFSQTQVICGIKSSGTYVNYENDLMFCKHLNLSSKQKMQLIQAINDHRDKFYDVEGLANIKPELEAESGGEDDEVEEEDNDEESEDEHDEGDYHNKENDHDEQEKYQEIVKYPKKRQKKNEKKIFFQVSFMSRLERGSSRLPSFNRNSSFWRMKSVGSDVLFPELNEIRD